MSLLKKPDTYNLAGTEPQVEWKDMVVLARVQVQHPGQAAPANCQL